VAARANCPAPLTEALTQSGNRETCAQGRSAIGVVHSPMLPLYVLPVPDNLSNSQQGQAIFINIKTNMRFVIYITGQNKKE
jgi:hypothetical protein